jgi:hypothetical protein
MTKKAKKLIIILSISAVLTGGTVLLFLLNGERNTEWVIHIICWSIWAFCIAPAYVQIYNWLSKKSFQEGFLIGVMAGDISGFWLFAFLIPLFMSPILAAMYYKNHFKKTINLGNKL